MVVTCRGSSVWHRKARGWGFRCASLLLVAVVFAAVSSAAAAGDGLLYEADIRRTAYGIPHIKAADYGSLGFGAGYAFAQDNLCVLADSILTASAERAKYLGATPTNIASDLFFQWMKDNEFVEKLLEGNGHFPPPTERARELVPGSPTTYLYGGEPREMTPRTVTITVQAAPGVFAEYSHTFWETHYGPVIQTAQMPWTETTAFAVRDVNADNLRALDLWLDINRASSVREIKALLDYYQGMPWVNTIAVDAFGEAFYGDHSVVPHVTPAKMAECGWPVLDGSRSACEWGTDPDAAVPGIFGPGNLPTLIRTDYATNMNNSYWLSNPDEPLTGFSPIIGSENSDIGLRARLGLLMIEERLGGTDGLEDTKFTLEQLQTVMFNNRHYGAELVRDDLVALCVANPSVTMPDGTVVDISEACDVLAQWDLRVDVDSRGAHVFHEFARLGGLRFRVPFDVSDPVHTPHTLDTDDPAVLAALAGAVQFWRDNNIPLDAAWGDVQNVTRAGQVIPIHGGAGGHGVFNAISSRFVDGVGYAEVTSGASFVMVVEFTEDGPVSRAVLAYSQSTNPESPHYADQTVLYSQKQWVDLKYDEDDILSDPELRVYTVRGARH